MHSTSLSGCIVNSLKQREMTAELATVLLSADRTKVRRRDETDYWDYKVTQGLTSPFDVAELARDVLAFHNARGGVLIVGVDREFHAVGLPPSHVVDTNVLHAKLRKYIGPTVSLFQDTIDVPNRRVLWLIFVPRREGAPVSVYANGPQDDKGRPSIRRNDYFIRIRDEVKLCVEPGDFERLFTGFSLDHLHAYGYDVDEPYFRLLAPHCEHFVGRHEILDSVREALSTRHPVVALDGVGGVGKSAVAIELTRQLYESQAYMFIVCQSAKTRVWHRYVGSRRPGFAGMTEFLLEIGRVLQVPEQPDLDRFKADVIQEMNGSPGLLLIDNIEEIQDPAILHFLSREVPEPVKVVVTSRVDKGLGALTISVPEMNDAEAKELLFDEMKRLAYKGPWNEDGAVGEVLTATGRLPLILKWTASLAVDLGSLRRASSKLRRTDSTKRELLSFCFATMYGELSPLTREVALLYPFLGEEWNSATIAAALDKPANVVSRAIHELRDRGIVMAASTQRDGGFSMLPLTVDFLSDQWHANDALRREVTTRLADAIAEPDSEGFFVNWPLDKRLEVMRRRCDQLRANGDFRKALQLVDLALTWSQDPWFRFMQGRLLHESGEKTTGLACMRAAIGMVRGLDTMTAERVYLAEALLSSGSAQEEAEAVKLLEIALPLAERPKREVLDRFAKLALELHEYASIVRVLRGFTKRESNATEPVLWTLESVGALLQDPVISRQYAEDIVLALEVVIRAREIEPSERARYQREAQRIGQFLKPTPAKSSLPPSPE